MTTLNYPRFFLVDIEDQIDEHLEHEEIEDVYAQKREAAIQWLGKKWVLHPAYQAELHPQHNVRIAS